MDLQLVQEAQEKEPGWWQWSIWLDGPAEELDQVERVEYILHSTFREPVQTVTDRATNFRLNAGGWGEFMIYAHVYLEDGHVEKHEHWLTLRDAPPRARRRRSSPGAGGGTRRRRAVSEEAQPVYLSYSVADSPFAGELAEALRTQGVTVVTDEDISIESPAVKAISSTTEEPSAVAGAVVVVSDARSGYMVERDVRRIQRQDIPVYLVLVGPDAHVPGDLDELPQIHLKDTQNADAAAAGVVAQLHGRAR